MTGAAAFLARHLRTDSADPPRGGSAFLPCDRIGGSDSPSPPVGHRARLLILPLPLIVLDSNHVIWRQAGDAQRHLPEKPDVECFLLVR